VHAGLRGMRMLLTQRNKSIAKLFDEFFGKTFRVAHCRSQEYFLQLLNNRLDNFINEMTRELK